MNLQKYASIYASFHHCHPSHVVNNDTIVLSFTDMRWQPWLGMRLSNFERITRSSQLEHSLKIFFNSESPSTTFLKKDYWTLLLGNERVVFPQDQGRCKLYATPYFVSDPRVVDEYLRGSARPTYENVYSYKNTILYLDPCDVPFPGGSYYSEQPKLCGRKNNDMFRLCFLSGDKGDYVAGIIREWKNRQGVMTLPFHVRDNVVVPRFLDFQPCRNMILPDEYSKSTGTLRKHVEFPNFIIQDVLLSFLGEFDEDDLSDNESSSSSNSSNQVHHLGLIMEWPFRVQYEGSRLIHQNSTSNNPKQFVAIAVNGSHPKNVLFVRDPYERYVEYDYVPNTAPWTEVLFVRGELPDFDMLPVVIDSVVIGFECNKKSAFFCLSHPLLEDRPRIPSTQRTECLLNKLDKHPESDSSLVVLETFRFDQDTLLHRVRPSAKGQHYFNWDLWCLSHIDDDDTAKQYPKRVRPPPLTENYLNFYSSNKTKHNNLGDPKVMQLATILANHNICFKTRIVEDKKDDVLVSKDEIIIQMKRAGVDFLNSVRLDANTITSNNQTEETESSTCTIA